jgi:hypothetical protein
VRSVKILVLAFLFSTVASAATLQTLHMAPARRETPKPAPMPAPAPTNHYADYEVLPA